MRLEEYEVKYPLIYTPGDTQSMRNALSKYTELILSGEAFEDDYCVAHFSHSCEKLSITYFQEYPVLVDFIKTKSYYSSDTTEDHLEDLQSTMTGEALFFLCALMHPELEMDIKASCEGIVKYSRNLNDSSRMWLTCEYPFGIEPLYITATVYPKYGYLLASFLVPYWDDEHMPEPLFVLDEWSRKLGITEDTIKAFCYCDNSRARENMLGYDIWDGGSSEPIESSFDLITYFRENEKAYESFINHLADRYEEMPYLQADDSDERYYIENPIRPLIVEMLYIHYPYETWDDDFDMDDYLVHQFIDTPADAAIEYIKETIENKLKRPIVPSMETIQKERERKARIERLTNRSVNPSETDKWKDLITKVFSNGDELWQYVTNGDNPQILETIEAVDLVSLAVKCKCILAEELKDAVRYSALSEKIYRLMRDYVSERCNIDYHVDNDVAREEVLRLYDILHLAMDKPTLHSETIEILVDDYELASIDELYQRYPTHWTKEIVSLSRELDERFLEKENELRLLNRIYDLINAHRIEGVEVLSSWFTLEKKSDEDDIFATKKSVSTKGYGLIAMYIIYRDHLLDVNDEITTMVKEFVENFIFDFVMNCMTEDGKWPKYSEVKWAKNNTFDNEYQKGCQREYLEGYELWKPMESYLKTGIFKDYGYDKSFNAALNYFIENLDIDDEEISDLQPQYEWLCSSNDENKVLFKMALWASQIDDLDSSELLSRVLKISLNVAPIRVVKYLEGVMPGLLIPENIDDFLRDLDCLKTFGLPESAYWIYQLNCLKDTVENEYIDLTNICEELEYVKHYVRLMKLYFDDIEIKKSSVDVTDLMIPELKNIQKLIREGGKLIPRNELSKIIKSAPIVLGTNLNYFDQLDELALNKIRRELRNNLEPLPRYIVNTLKRSGESFKEERVKFFDMISEKSIEVLESYGAKLLSDSEMNKVKIQLEDDQWNTVVINNVNNYYEDVYHGNVIDYCYTKLKSDSELELNYFDLKIIENMSSENAQAFKALRSIDYKEFGMSCFEQFINYQVPFGYIKDLLSCGIYDYNFLGTGGYHDVYLNDILLDVRPNVRNRILHIIGGIDPSKLDLVDENKLESYVDFMFNQKLDREIILQFLVYLEEDDLIEKFALKTDCSAFIKRLSIEDQVSVLELVAKHPPYHPLVIELEKHKSLKIRKCVNVLIEKYHIKSNSKVTYHIVDYGIYRMGGPTQESDKEDVSKVVNEPICINSTDSFIAEKNMYFGLRFTADDPSNAPKVCVHKVVVTHPYRNENNEIITSQSRWDQNGYSKSNIFLGWFFDENEEILGGNYHLAAFDTDGNLMVEQSFSVTL